MTQKYSDDAPDPVVYEAYISGDISDRAARCHFGDGWESIQQLERVEGILGDQPEPDVSEDKLYR